ncbi:MAG: hypothetical protein ACI4VC_05140 [Clostridia bacterium]
MNERYDLNFKEQEKKNYENTLSELLREEKLYTQQLDSREEVSK